MNSQSLNPLTQQHIDCYRRDGVVLIRGLLDAEWIARMQAANSDSASAAPMPKVSVMNRNSRTFAVTLRCENPS